MINVIALSTSEREAETKKLFQRVKPLMDKGYTLHAAVLEVEDYGSGNVCNRAWYRELKKYARSKGY